MSTSGDDHGPSPSSEVTNEGWMEKKEALLNSLSEGRSALKIDRQKLTRERQRLVSEIERLEEENHLMAKSVKDFQLQLSEKRRRSKTLVGKSEDLKKKLQTPKPEEEPETKKTKVKPKALSTKEIETV